MTVSDAYLGHSQISTMVLFAKLDYGQNRSTVFVKETHAKCLTGSKISL